MSFSGRQRIFLETNMARDKAEALLARLLNAQRVLDAQSLPLRRGDIVSRRSMDQAISSTKRIIETMNEELRQACDDLYDDALKVLDEFDAEFLESEAGRNALDLSMSTIPLPAPDRPRRPDATPVRKPDQPRKS